MNTRTDDVADADYLARTMHHVDAPDIYQDWRTYAFSSAPELQDSARPDAPPAKANPTV